MSRAVPPDSDPFDLDRELRQHEMPALHWFDANRRDFLKVVGGGLIV